MRRFIYIVFFVTAVFCMSACVVQEMPEDRLYIRFNLQETPTETRLSYEPTEIEGRAAIMTKWTEGDVISITASPYEVDRSASFELIEGAGSTSGLFSLTSGISNVNNISSSLWTLYYPGDKIRSDWDFYECSYSGQIQKGNGSMEHLGDFHSLRVRCAELGNNVFLNQDMIDITADNVEESSCMRFKLEGLPSIIPVQITLSYVTPYQGLTPLFYTYNQSETWRINDCLPNSERTSEMILELEDFEATTDITAYMMMSNGPIKVINGSYFSVIVTASDNTRYECRKRIDRNTELKGGRLHTITASDWNLYGSEGEEEDPGELPDEIPDGKVYVLQEASIDNGADIVLMGDGFDIYDFGGDNLYRQTMLQAYEDIFSVEPFASLKEYFNVYYINAVSENKHDAVPYYDAYGNQNGAINGSASTVFSTKFTPGNTSISANNQVALEFATQAIKTKGGKGGTECSDSEALSRAFRALSVVMINVRCYAGVCLMAWSESDYGNAYSIAYVPLSQNEFQRKMTLIHEACGHGFGKLSDEYGGDYLARFSTSLWDDLKNKQKAGIGRNVNEHWTDVEMADGWNFEWTQTTEQNVYWSDLLTPTYDYKDSEGLGIYRGGYTCANLFCRPSENSVMRHQFSENGQYFNAISRWAIWFRLQRLTGLTNPSDFHSSLDDFIQFDSNLNIDYSPVVKSDMPEDSDWMPLADPIMVPGYWDQDTFIPLR